MPAAAGLTRRSLAYVLAGLGLAHDARAQPEAWRPGLQLYTVRDLLGADMEGTLGRVAELGYREVEPAGMAGSTARAMRASLGRHRLAVPSMHAGFDRLREDLAAVVEEAHVLGAHLLVCPSIDAAPDATSDDWRRAWQTLAGIGRTVRERGLALAYHNHDFEFVPFKDGTTPLDLMKAETDPRDVGLELDVYWVARAGFDPVRCLADNRDRVVLVHLKDLGADGATVELGRGVLDIEAIIRTARSAGVKHLFVEQDDSADPLASIASSFRFLERLPPDVRPDIARR